MEYWFAEQEARLRNLPTTKRYLYEKIDWSARCLGILGARGTGKTTMMLQHLTGYQPETEKALYVSIDHPRFQTRSLHEFGREFRNLSTIFGHSFLKITVAPFCFHQIQPADLSMQLSVLPVGWEHLLQNVPDGLQKPQ